MPNRPVRRSLALAVVASIAVPASAGAVSVRDPDIGWSPAARRALGLRAVAKAPCGDPPLTRRALRVQSRYDKHPAIDRRLPSLFRMGTVNRWGSLWFDACDGDRFEIGVASGPDLGDARRKVARARRFLRAQHFTSRSYRLVAVRSTYRQLSDEQDALPIDDLITAGLVSTGIDTRRNAIVIEYATLKITPQQRSRVFAARTRSPVSIVVQPVKTDSLEITTD